MTSGSELRRAVFLDRDGTICEEIGYVNHLNRLHVYPYAAPSIRRLNEAGLAVIVVTNQSGIAQGMFTVTLLERVHEKLIAELAKGGARLDGIYYCPHKLDDACGCRKPRPGLLERAAREHGLDLAKSIVVGDRYLDLEMGFRCGAKGILVLTGYGLGDYELHQGEWPKQPNWVAKDLAEAVDIILSEAR
jgi:D-glycero-D-manno-heptose 1,7-bisphosphate phosphatase